MRKHLPALAPLLLAACVLGPTDLQIVASTGPRTFSGYSQTPSSVVRVRALDQRSGQWITIASAIASASPDVGCRPGRAPAHVALAMAAAWAGATPWRPRSSRRSGWGSWSTPRAQ